MVHFTAPVWSTMAMPDPTPLHVRWRGGQYHDDFYTDPTIRGWYQAYVAHLLNHPHVDLVEAPIANAAAS